MYLTPFDIVTWYLVNSTSYSHDYREKTNHMAVVWSSHVVVGRERDKSRGSECDSLVALMGHDWDGHTVQRLIDRADQHTLEGVLPRGVAYVAVPLYEAWWFLPSE